MLFGTEVGGARSRFMMSSEKSIVGREPMSKSGNISRSMARSVKTSRFMLESEPTLDALRDED